MLCADHGLQSGAAATAETGMPGLELPFPETWIPGQDGWNTIRVRARRKMTNRQRPYSREFRLEAVSFGEE